MREMDYHLGEILIAKIKRGSGDEWYLFLPHEEVHRQGGRGPYSSCQAAKEALWRLIPIDARKYVKER
jgi:hypothetical protein